MQLSRRQFHRGSAAVVASALAGEYCHDYPVHAAESTLKPCPTHEDTFGRLKSGNKIPVIFDTDLGGDIDDTWALLYLLKCPELDVRLIATDAGLGDYRTSLAAKFLTEVSRTEIPLAISVGPKGGRSNQQDWVGDYHHAEYEGIVHEDAADAIIRTIKESSDPVTLVCVGAVPNIAESLRRDPSICQNARFVGMHGAIRVGYGGHAPVVPEANVRNGIEPLRDTFAARWECSVTPLDTCGIVDLAGERYAKVSRSDSVGVKELMENYRHWLNRVSWLKVKPDPKSRSTTLFDLVAVTMAFSEEWMEMQTLPLSIDDKGITAIDETNGQPVRCAMAWKDLDGYKDHVVERLISGMA
ncbi:nucleoside hydrolase [Novipirellula artificiosorum]|uniref:Ribonucleoside hydrolase RihC n=1 Tax=Novipirellula artificiosorum TaxID=2528016 RepID=A0A5C6DH05_9BACT|nr:nucleoside hydrolase [Novipirellula artificiosorum]TWU35928.1 ribonucleoside hydrolase RihC [Novipirellula artificiosorum]